MEFRPPLYRELEGVSVTSAAQALGFQIGKKSGFTRPCPCCSAERRGSEDPRGSLRVYGWRGHEKWKCSRCDVGGDAAALVLAVATGYCPAARVPGGASEGWERARVLAERVGLVQPRAGSGRVDIAPVRVTPATGYAEAAERVLPPAHEVAALWGACGPVSRVPPAMEWLRSRGIDAEAVQWLELARVCPKAEWKGWQDYPWARCMGRSWGEGWRLVLPGYNAYGKLMTLRARWVLDEPPKGGKEVAPAGHLSGPAMYANKAARGSGCQCHKAVIVEGGPAWLRYAVAAEGHAAGPVAVVGLWAGSWDRALAQELFKARHGWTVATDDDEAGNKYAAAVLADAAALGVRAERWRLTTPEAQGRGPDDAGVSLDELLTIGGDNGC